MKHSVADEVKGFAELLLKLLLLAVLVTVVVLVLSWASPYFNPPCNSGGSADAQGQCS